MAHDLAERFPLNTAINRYWLPTIYASIEIRRNNPAKALEDLQATAPYELGSPLPQFEVGGSLYPVYIRGEVYLLLHQGKEAAAEFQKFLDHRGVCRELPFGSVGTPSARPRLRLAGRHRPIPSCLSRFLYTVEGRRPRHSHPHHGQIRIRQTEVIARGRCSPDRITPGGPW